MAATGASSSAPTSLEEVLKKVNHVELGQKNGPMGLKMNPVVTIGSAVVVWVFIAFCIVMPDRMLNAMNDVAFEWIPDHWTWFYIISQDIWIVVLVYLCIIPRYANLKFGRDDEEPSFSNATWFAMLFSAGVAVGLFYYSVAEPLWHYMGSGNPSFYRGAKGYGNENEDATNALVITYYHWGIHGWIAYTTMGAVIAIMYFRRGFPMTIRYCFWPLLGEHTFGLLGDAVDALSIMTTLFGVCTSLGLGAMQVNQGLQRLNHGFYRGTNHEVPNEAKYVNPTCDGTGQSCASGTESYGIQTNVMTQIIIIIVITVLATISVMSGIGQGIKNLSRLNFALGMFFLLSVLFLGETYFILDAIVQSVGLYMWSLLKLGFHCDAFERLGAKAMGRGGPSDNVGGGDGWMTGWTVFYWGWWISWGPFMGVFLARISKGRTLRQFIIGTLFLPTLYSCFWFGVCGSEGIRMQRLADSGGLCNTTYALSKLDDGASLCTGGWDYDGDSQISSKCLAYSSQFSDDYKKEVGMGWNPPCVLDPNFNNGYGRCKQEEWERWVVVGDECVESLTWVDVPCGGGEDPTKGAVPTTGPCAGKGAYSDWNRYPASSQPDCFVPLQDGVVCLYNQGTTDIIFDQISSYGPRGFSDFLSVVALIGLTLYFVTSSDSGSYVIDVISANGLPDPPILQRIFWSMTEGATACALLAAGRNLPNAQGSLRALQSVSLAMGLPYTLVLFWCSQSLVLLCKEETGELDPNRKAFSTFIFALPTSPERGLMLLKNTLAPGITMGRVIGMVGGWPSPSESMQTTAGLVWGACLQVVLLLSIIVTFCGFTLYGWVVIGLVLYIIWGALLGFLRIQFRETYEIKHGDMITDLLAGIFTPMLVLTQMELHMANDTLPPREKLGDKGGVLDDGKVPEVAASPAAAP